MAFYTALGWRKSDASVDGEVAFFHTEGPVLALWGTEKLARDADLPAEKGAFDGVALAINLASPADVDAGLAAAVEAGGTILKIGTRADWGGYSGYFADPDGHTWEVAYNPGWPLDERGLVELPVAGLPDADEPREGRVGALDRLARDELAGGVCDLGIAGTEVDRRDTPRREARDVGPAELRPHEEAQAVDELRDQRIPEVRRRARLRLEHLDRVGAVEQHAHLLLGVGGGVARRESSADDERARVGHDVVLPAMPPSTRTTWSDSRYSSPSTTTVSDSCAASRPSTSVARWIALRPIHGRAVWARSPSKRASKTITPWQPASTQPSVGSSSTAKSPASRSGCSAKIRRRPLNSSATSSPS